jgi:hypothetical protein
MIQIKHSGGDKPNFDDQHPLSGDERPLVRLSPGDERSPSLALLSALLFLGLFWDKYFWLNLT